MKKFRFILPLLIGAVILIPVEQAAAAPRIVRQPNPKPLKISRLFLKSPVFIAFLNQYQLKDKINPVSIHY